MFMTVLYVLVVLWSLPILFVVFLALPIFLFKHRKPAPVTDPVDLPVSVVEAEAAD